MYFSEYYSATIYAISLYFGICRSECSGFILHLTYSSSTKENPCDASMPLTSLQIYAECQLGILSTTALPIQQENSICSECCPPHFVKYFRASRSNPENNMELELPT